MRCFIGVVLLLLSACDNQSQHLALGTLERDRIAHSATVNEVVIALPVAKGAFVEKGTVLVQLDDTYQVSVVKQAEATVQLTQANLEKLRNGARSEEIAAARAKSKGAEAVNLEAAANYNRSQQLLVRHFISQSEMDSARAARDTARADLKKAQEELRELTNGTRVEDLQMAESELNAALAALASEQKKLADLTITATRSGILDNLPWNLGERVTSGSPLAIVMAGKAPFARVYIPEPYRAKLHIGDKLIVHVDGLADSITGELRWIATDPAFTPYYALNQEERARLMYLAEVQLPDDQARLPSGIPAQVELP